VDGIFQTTLTVIGKAPASNTERCHKVHQWCVSLWTDWRSFTFSRCRNANNWNI